jgi:phospholipid/cholesterol/gamma-HCH transport system substrate-binding protein
MCREVKIGIFVAGTILIMAVFIFIVGDLSTWFRKPGYPLSTSFPSVIGLESKAAVRLAGVKIGYVKEIRLVENRAQLLLSIFPQYKIPKDSRAGMATLGLVGEKFIEIIPGVEAVYCAPGDSLAARESVGFEQLGGLALSIGEEIKEVSRSLRGITGEDARQNLQGLLQNMSSFSRELDQFLAENKDDLQKGVRAASAAAGEMSEKIGAVTRNLEETSGLLREIALENRDSIKGSLEKVQEVLQEMDESVRLLREALEKIHRGEGTVGRLVQDPGLYDEARETLETVQKTAAPFSRMRLGGDVRAEYLGDSRKVKSYITARFSLAPRSFLLGQVVEDPRVDGFRYSAQAGLRFGPLAARAGIIESELGAGLDYLALSDRLLFSLEGYDFQRDGGPRFRLATQYALWKYLYLVLGVDDFARASEREVYFGLGLGTR